ncbi:MAG: hypothetical protein ACI9VM_000747 [Candidatus Azotimanducaceae bacterium]|jgi:hypothetical protein
MSAKRIFIGVAVVAVLLIVWSRSAEQQSGENDASVIAANGVHWHPKLEITILGEEFPIPANIGLIGGHNPMHTHAPEDANGIGAPSDGIIHLEYEGVVREDDTRLSRFFEIWGKEFNNNQIFNNVNSASGTVRMYVNGEESTEFENYMMQHEDRIEIKFE